MADAPAPSELLKAGDVEGAIWAASRSDAARLVHEALGRGDVTFAAARDHIPLLWQSTDYPCRRLAISVWLAWFRNAALPMPAPPQCATRVWRAQCGDELGLSWSYDRAVAERFQNQNVARGYPNARLLQADITSEAIVWHIPGPESEILLDPEGSWAHGWQSKFLVWGTVDRLVGGSPPESTAP